MKITTWMKTIVLSLMLATASLNATSTLAETAKPKLKPAQTQLVVAPVNINKANAELLATVMKGVGEKRAKAIVAYRKQHGPFKTVSQLSNIKGIGEATLLKNKGRITAK